jgi:hypothetical protein
MLIEMQTVHMKITRNSYVILNIFTHRDWIDVFYMKEELRYSFQVAAKETE